MQVWFKIHRKQKITENSILKEKCTGARGREVDLLYLESGVNRTL